jgi:hypothetical protein
MNNREAVLEESQRVLVEFLHAELTVAFTFLQIATLKGNDPDWSQLLIKRAQRALQNARSMNRRVQDRAAGQWIRARASELETALRQNGTVPHPTTPKNQQHPTDKSKQHDPWLPGPPIPRSAIPQ